MSPGTEPADHHGEMTTLFILNDPPYGTERCYNALRLAGALAGREGEDGRRQGRVRRRQLLRRRDADRDVEASEPTLAPKVGLEKTWLHTKL
jgi:hypothetical protein